MLWRSFTLHSLAFRHIAHVGTSCPHLSSAQLPYAPAYYHVCSNVKESVGSVI
jgi:hypothetical protein